MEPTAMDRSAAGLRIERLRMELVARNLANVDTTSVRREPARSPAGDAYLRHVPYRRQMLLENPGPGGIPVAHVVEDRSPLRAEHRPGHPHAVPESSGAADAGTVYFPNVDPLAETVDMIAASRAYEANLTALEVEKAMDQEGLRILG